MTKLTLVDVLTYEAAEAMVKDKLKRLEAENKSLHAETEVLGEYLVILTEENRKYEKALREIGPLMGTEEIMDGQIKAKMHQFIAKEALDENKETEAN